MISGIRLATDIDRIVGASIAAAHCNDPGDTTTEVDVLHQLFASGLEWIFDLIEAGPLSGKVAMAGVYCHQRPYVRWPPAGTPPAGRCEIGDLLVVAYHRPTGTRQAILLQAKVDGRPDVTGDQETLYTSWPRFRYVARPHEERQLTSAPHPGARYAYFALCDACAAPASRCLAVARCGGSRLPRLVGHRAESAGVIAVGAPGTALRSAGALIAAMILGHPAGAPVLDPATAAGSEGWDAVVWDLLRRNSRLGVRYTYRRASRTISGEPRVRSAGGLLFDASMQPVGVAATGGDVRLEWCPEDIRAGFGWATEGAAEDAEGGWLPPRPREEDEEPDGGIPMLLIESDVGEG